VRWLQTAAVVGATVVLMASSCSWQVGTRIPEGVPPPTGDPVPAIDINAKGRPADQLHEWAAARAPALEMPVEALEAYAYAARVAEVVNPKCKLSWPTLAGIGMVESHHGTYRGATIAPNGDVRPPIRGVRLDGTAGNMRIPDTDGGELDGDDDLDRAMGPMQFIPETWKLYGVDANNDGEISPDNFDDAALSAAGYLCWRGKDLSTPRGWMDALRAYNYSDSYARTVRDWATAYADGHAL
jgi:membrane-bound lytic murein transglycosylase B